MPAEPSEPPRQGRIILPGEEHKPDENAAARRIVLPPGEEPEPEERAAAPRIVLPPGAGTEPAEDLPEYPRLRPLELIPIREGEQELLLVQDPLGVMPAPAALRLETIELLRLMDGTVSLGDLCAAVVRGTKDVRSAGFVREFVAQLDRMLMLESPRFEQAHAELRRAYHQLEIRPAVLEGVSYPAERAALEAFLDAHFAQAEAFRTQAGDPPAASDACPRALLAPHLDPRRAGPVIARTWLELGTEQTEPLRVIVYGTGHALLEETFALTRKHFETPLGQVRCDTAFVDAVAERLGEAAWRGELAHRDEHSIEFQTLDLRGRFGDRPVRIVPILCGGFHALQMDGRTPHDDQDLERLIGAIRDVERAQGGRTVHLASVDLSHVGTRFGEAAPDERTLGEIQKKDHEALEAAQRGDAEAWYQAIAAHQDSTRICGWGATYVMLRWAEPGAGRLLRYEPSSEPGGSMVSVASMAWP